MKKRGQVTIFIVLGIIVFIFFGIYFYANNVSSKIKTQSAVTTSLDPSDSEIVAVYAESCIKRIGQEALFNRIGLHGGYIDPDGNPEYGEEGAAESTSYLGNKVPYYLERTDSRYVTLYPSGQKISKKLANYMIVEFEKCLKPDAFEQLGIKIIKPNVNYQSIGFDFSRTEVKVDISMNKEDVTINLHYPLLIKKGKNEAKLSSFSATLPIRLKALYDSSEELVNKIMSMPNGEYTITPSDCNSFDKNGLTNVYIKTSDDGAKIVQFVDFSTYMGHYFNSYIFQFAVKNVDVNGGCVG